MNKKTIFILIVLGGIILVFILLSKKSSTGFTTVTVGAETIKVDNQSEKSFLEKLSEIGGVAY